MKRDRIEEMLESIMQRLNDQPALIATHLSSLLDQRDAAKQSERMAKMRASRKTPHVAPLRRVTPEFLEQVMATKMAYDRVAERNVYPSLAKRRAVIGCNQNLLYQCEKALDSLGRGQVVRPPGPLGDAIEAACWEWVELYWDRYWGRRATKPTREEPVSKAVRV